MKEDIFVFVFLLFCVFLLIAPLLDSNNGHDFTMKNPPKPPKK